MSSSPRSPGCCVGTRSATPAAVWNRPGLPALDRRIGTHRQFLDSMLARLSAADRPELAPLTTREPDDPSIALLDGWAVIADVLTFYQERIANEGYLRTATEQDSLTRLGQARRAPPPARARGRHPPRVHPRPGDQHDDPGGLPGQERPPAGRAAADLRDLRGPHRARRVERAPGPPHDPARLHPGPCPRPQATRTHRHAPLDPAGRPPALPLLGPQGRQGAHRLGGPPRPRAGLHRRVLRLPQRGTAVRRDHGPAEQRCTRLRAPGAAEQDRRRHQDPGAGAAPGNGHAAADRPVPVADRRPAPAPRRAPGRRPCHRGRRRRGLARPGRPARPGGVGRRRHRDRGAAARRPGDGRRHRRGARGHPDAPRPRTRPGRAGRTRIPPAHRVPDATARRRRPVRRRLRRPAQAARSRPPPARGRALPRPEHRLRRGTRLLRRGAVAARPGRPHAAPRSANAGGGARG